MSILVIKDAIGRIKDKCPIFEKRVFGVFEFDQATNKDDMVKDHPACYVLPFGGRNEEDGTGNMSAQRIERQFLVMICADARTITKEGKQLLVVEILEQIEAQMKLAFLNWNPVDKNHTTTVKYVDDRYISLNNNEYWHQYRWKYSYPIDTDYNEEGNMQNMPDAVRDLLYSDYNAGTNSYPIPPVSPPVGDWLYNPGAKQFIMDKFALGEDEYDALILDLKQFF